MKKIGLFILFSLVSHCCCCLFAQNTADSLLQNVRSQYAANIGAASYLYNGTFYAPYWNGVRGNPFFLSGEFQPGNIYYDGVSYSDVPILYDIMRDELVIKNYAKDADITLLVEKIRQFTVGAHQFVRIAADSSRESFLPTGFYEKLYAGHITVYAKHEKKIERSLKAEDNFSKFTQYDRYYLEKNGVYHPINSESEILSVLKDRRKDVREMLNRKDIRFKKDPAGTLVQIATLYDGLK